MKTEAGPYDFLPVAGSFARGSVTLDVTNSLRAAIVNLALPPGTVLDKSAICAQFGVSRFPVSEALARLADEGLVDIAPQRGSTVSLVRIADVREYMLIRKGLESEALRVLIGKHDAEVISALHQNMAAQRAAAAKDDAELFHQLDVDFHDIIFPGHAAHQGQIDHRRARANLDRARRLIITPRRLALTIAEHQKIFDAVLNENTPLAITAIREHIDAVMVELFAFAREHPDLFADGPHFAGATDNFPFG